MIAQKWSEFLEKTAQLTKAEMISGIIPSEEIEDYHVLIAGVLRQFAAEAKPMNGLKTFVDGQQDNQFNERLIQDPPKENERLEAWANRFFADRSFGMIMNFLEDYSNDLVAKVGAGVWPLVENAGLPFRGLSNLFFLGNYGYTPFGAHKGTFGEDGFLFHLGPAPKVFYTWDTDEYIAMTGGMQGCRDYEKIMPSAKEHLLMSGDAMYIPSDVYHLANTDTFSVSLILDYRKSTHEMVKKTLIEQMMFTDADANDLVEPFKQTNSQSLGVEFMPNFDIAFKRQMALLKSNAHYGTPSRKISANVDIARPFKLKSPFVIIHEKINDRSYLYARGHEFVYADYENMKPVIDALNDGNLMSWETVQKTIPELTLDVFIQLVALLSQTDILAWE